MWTDSNSHGDYVGMRKYKSLIIRPVARYLLIEIFEFNEILLLYKYPMKQHNFTIENDKMNERDLLDRLFIELLNFSKSLIPLTHQNLNLFFKRLLTSRQMLNEQPIQRISFIHLVVF